MTVCPVCGATDLVDRWRSSGSGTESGVDPRAFQPSSVRFGRTVGMVVACQTCGHSVVAELPRSDAISRAYLDAADPVSLREEVGQVETARRALALIERWSRPGRLLDVGCWTGSFLVAARERGWTTSGIEPSGWAVERARARGLDVSAVELGEADLGDTGYDAIVACDVLEHLADPNAALEQLRNALDPAGVLYLTVPDAGSRLAKMLGRRWWSVLPMHLQYFTRSSLTLLLDKHGMDVVELRTHPKVFSVRYYAERLAAFAPGAGSLPTRLVSRLRIAERLVAPDFRDRMAVIATPRRS